MELSRRSFLAFAAYFVLAPSAVGKVCHHNCPPPPPPGGGYGSGVYGANAYGAA